MRLFAPELALPDVASRLPVMLRGEAPAFSACILRLAEEERPALPMLPTQEPVA